MDMPLDNNFIKGWGNMKPIVTEKSFEINYHEIDYKKRALFTTIMQYFEDGSMDQSEKLGVGFEYLKENNIAWILYKWDVQIKRYPLFGEKVIVRTMPYGCRKFYAYRRFEVVDSNGEVIAIGNSIWFLIDLNKKRLKKVTDDIKKPYGLEGLEEEPFKIEKLKLPDKEFTYKKHFTVRYSDIDTNLHVNNVKYISWVIETIPLEVILEYTMSRLIISYEKEVNYGNDINVYGEIIEEEEGKLVFLHKVEDMEGNKTTLAKTYWYK